MAERYLSDREVRQMKAGDDETAMSTHAVKKRSGKDRRIAICTYVAPEMDRRSGFDRRRNG